MDIFAAQARAMAPRPQRLFAELLTQSPLGLWRMNDPSLTAAFRDSTSNNRTATQIGNTITPAHLRGPDGVWYADFDGTNGYCQLADANDWTISGGRTWFVIVKPDITSLLFLFDKGASVGTYEWSVRINQGGAGEIRLETIQLGGTTIRAGVTATGIVSTSIWNVIAVTIDSTPSSSSTITINHNGSWKSVTHSGSGGTYSNGTANVLIGARGDAGTQRFDGHMAFATILPLCSAAVVDSFMAAAHEEGWF